MSKGQLSEYWSMAANVGAALGGLLMCLYMPMSANLLSKLSILLCLSKQQ